MDTYAAGSKEEVLRHPDIRIQKIYDFQSTYGIVLAGDSRKLRKCSHSYMLANKVKIYEHIKGYIQTIKVGYSYNNNNIK